MAGSVIGGGASACGAPTKAGGLCSVNRVPGKQLCAAHDPETRAKAQSEGGKSWGAERRPSFLSAEQAAESIKLQSRTDVPATIEAVARAVASGELDTKVGNALFIAANAALSAADSIDKASNKNASSLSDEELEAAVEEFLVERQARIGANQ